MPIDDKSRLGRCDFCDFPAMTREYRRQSSVNRPWQEGATKRLCDFCARTRCGSAADYGDQYDGEINTMRTVAYAANLLLVAGAGQFVHPVWLLVDDREGIISDREDKEEA